MKTSSALLLALSFPVLFGSCGWIAGGGPERGPVTPEPHGATSYTPLAYLPESDDGVPTTVQWIHGAALILKDKVGGDLLGFFRGDSSLHAAVSADDGRSWSWVNPSAIVDIDPALAIAQGNDGRVHIAACSWSRGVSYNRVNLVRDGAGHISDFTREVSGVSFPSDPYPADVSIDLTTGEDRDGNPTLFYAIYDDLSDRSLEGGEVVIGKTRASAGLSPSSSDDFVALDGSNGATPVEIMKEDSWASPHNAGVFMAQHPISKDLWIQWGPLNTGDGLTQNTLPIRRARATPSGGSAFALGSTVTVAVYKGMCGTQNYAVVSSPRSVWFLYGDSESAVIIDRADAQGNVTPAAIPSPYDDRDSGGCFTLAVDDTEENMWFAGQVAYEAFSPTITNRVILAKHWDGAAWTTICDEIVAYDRFRIARSTGWNDGLVFLQQHFDYDTYRPIIGTIRTLP